jgi:ubiquinone/menaquinone biosynthesis C-methylase UbiE
VRRDDTLSNLEVVATAYDRWAAQYDDDPNLTRDLDAEIVRRAPLRLAGSDVVELGCGTGKNTAWLASEARHVHALDVSRGMLARARRQVVAPNVTFTQHDVRVPWPVAPQGIDVVVGNLVLEHIGDLSPIYANAARALRAGGQLFLCELHPFRQARGAQAHFTERSTGETVKVPAFPHTTDEYVDTAAVAGFVLRDMGQWMDGNAPSDDPPRLLSLLFDRG